MLEREDIEAVIACLGDDAAQLRDENPEDERADNMDRAATMLRELADSNAAVARLLLDQDRDGAKDWVRGLHINMDSEGGLTSGVPVDGLTHLHVRTRRPQDYVLHNEQDGTRWRGTADGRWVRDGVALPREGQQ